MDGNSVGVKKDENSVGVKKDSSVWTLLKNEKNNL